MNKISCNTIQDLLPLYCDDVCSLDSKEMIEEHLQKCANCSDILQQLKCEYKISTKTKTENRGESAALGKMALLWKHSLLKAFIIGISIASIIFLVILGTYYGLFLYKGSMVSPEQVSVAAYMVSDEQITFRLQPVDGYCGGTIKSYVDENSNLYISIQRAVIKEYLPNGEEEVMNYGFNQSKKEYMAVYYGTPDNFKLLWKQGDTLPTADIDTFK